MKNLLFSSIALLAAFLPSAFADGSDNGDNSWSHGNSGSKSSGYTRNSFCGTTAGAALFRGSMFDDNQQWTKNYTVTIDFQKYFMLTFENAFVNAPSDVSYMALESLKASNAKREVSVDVRRFKKVSASHIGPPGQGQCVFVQSLSTDFGDFNVGGNLTEVPQAVNDKLFDSGHLEYSVTLNDLSRFASKSDIEQCYIIATAATVVPDLGKSLVTFNGQNSIINFDWLPYMTCLDSGLNLPVTAKYTADVDDSPLEYFFSNSNLSFNRICFTVTPNGCQNLYWDPATSPTSNVIVISGSSSKSTSSSKPLATV